MESLFKKTILPNGMRIVTEYMPHVRSVSFGVWLQVGSRDESDTSNGISHFMEHMVFKGTSNRTTAEIAESLESVGGNLNAFTGKEFTCYYAHILDENVDLAVNVISDLMCNALMNSDDIKKEKQVIIEEINSLNDTPEELIHEYFQENIFSDHPLSYSILGEKQNILKFTRDQLVEYHTRRYINDNIVISAAGNIRHEDLIESINRYFVLESGVSPVRSNGLIKKSSQERVYKRAINQAHICIGNTALSYSDKRKYTLLILHSILGGGMSSRLFQNIREKYGVAYTIFSFADFYLDTGLFGVYIGVDKSNIKKSIELIKREFDTIINELVSERELNRYKSQLKGSLILGMENTYSVMNRLARMEIYLNNYITLEKVIESIESVTAENINTLARKYLSGDLCTTIITPN
ncbi:M16 family metallopeptidase [candidate division KSB1 bacterium]